MVSRLDAPQPGLVPQMIRSSLRAEAQGLAGRLVLDSRTIPAAGENAKPGSPGHFDQSFRDLAALVRGKTDLAMLLDDSPDLLPPGSAADRRSRST